MLYTIIDIETNGRSHLSDVLEVGYMRVNKKMEVIQKGQFYFYKPEWSIENQAQSVHGLQRSFLRAQCPDDETFRENLVKLYTLMTRGVVIGKRSNRFDIPVLQCFMSAHMDNFVDYNMYGTLDIEDFYTDKFRDYYYQKFGVSTRKQGKLGELVEMIGYTQDQVKQEFIKTLGEESRAQAHGALYDVFMTYLLLRYAIENYNLQI